MIITNQLIETHSKSELRLISGDTSAPIMKQILQARTEAFSSYIGTEKLDTDSFDEQYDHLYLYNAEEEEVIGAYRLGYGYRSALYSFSQFEPHEKLNGIQSRCLDLGRSFVSKKHQQSFMPLMKLWRGIYKVFLEDDQLEFIIGCASIPGDLPQDFKDDILTMLNINFRYWSDDIAVGKSPMCINSNESFADVKTLENHYKEKGQKLRVPVLLNKYLSQNGKVLGFNLDKDFGNSIDVLMILNKKDILEITKEWLS